MKPKQQHFGARHTEILINRGILNSDGTPARTTLHAAQPADRVTDNCDQFRKRWQRVSTATHFTEAGQ